MHGKLGMDRRTETLNLNPERRGSQGKPTSVPVQRCSKQRVDEVGPTADVQATYWTCCHSRFQQASFTEGQGLHSAGCACLVPAEVSSLYCCMYLASIWCTGTAWHAP